MINNGKHDIPASTTLLQHIANPSNQQSIDYIHCDASSIRVVSSTRSRDYGDISGRTRTGPASWVTFPLLFARAAGGGTLLQISGSYCSVQSPSSVWRCSWWAFQILSLSLASALSVDTYERPGQAASSIPFSSSSSSSSSFLFLFYNWILPTYSFRNASVDFESFLFKLYARSRCPRLLFFWV